jgi:hypothetical protein
MHLCLCQGDRFGQDHHDDNGCVSCGMYACENHRANFGNKPHAGLRCTFKQTKDSGVVYLDCSNIRHQSFSVGITCLQCDQEMTREEISVDIPYDDATIKTSNRLHGETRRSALADCYRVLGILGVGERPCRIRRLEQEWRWLPLPSIM